ncbi:MAG: hypothetical protein HGA49_01465 [Eubacteriaceae bacterium]|nr:hypothetical protein [Eubacteriaceae bacterium]
MNKVKVLNNKVHHDKFGEGIVTDQTISKITIQFSEEFGEKKFMYPSAFESFLTMGNPALQEMIDDELRTIRKQLEAEGKQREEEAEQRRIEEQRALLKKKLSAKKCTAKRKAPAIPKTKPVSTESDA